jgi:hypothetical protein
MPARPVDAKEVLEEWIGNITMCWDYDNYIGPDFYVESAVERGWFVEESDALLTIDDKKYIVSMREVVD